MTGTIRCNKCRKKMDGVCECGNYKCLVEVYWQGKYYPYRRDAEGDVFSYHKAIDKLIEINTAIKAGTFNPEESSDAKVAERRFEAVMERWLDQKEQEEKLNELSPETVRPYQSYNRNYFTFFEGYDVREIDFEVLERFKDGLPAGLKLHYKRNILSCLHGFFVWLRRKGVIKEMPVWPEIKGNDADPQMAMEIEEQLRILELIPEEHRDIYAFMMETGLRPGEACAMKVKDVYMKAGKAMVRRTWRRSKLADTTKGRNKKPTYFSDTAYEIVKRNMDGKFGEEFLFINPVVNRGYKQECLRKRWRKHTDTPLTLKEATRHSYCTQIAETPSCNSLQAQELMRHADLRSTQKYFHGTESKMKEIVNQRGKVIPLNREVKKEMG